MHNDVDELELAVSKRLEVARATWSSFHVADRDFAAYLVERSVSGELPALAHAADLFLACACSAGDQKAHAAFHASYDQVVTRVLLKRGADADALGDLKQVLFEKLLLAAPPSSPKIVNYKGAGPLKSWIASVAVTTLLMSRRSTERRRERPAEDDSLVGPVLETGPELRYLKQSYREPVAAALVFALRKLGERERTLLRLQLCEKLSIDRLGEMHGVNRATAARWLVTARQTLLRTTREELRRTLNINDSECDSILNLVHSQLDVSVVRHLG